MKLCQLIILALFVWGFFASLRSDFHGRKAREPYGFQGAVITVVLHGMMFFVYWVAGAFTEVF